MITDSSRSGIQMVMFLALRGDEEPTSPRHIAERLGLSPTYLAKISSSLVKAGVLRATRGSKGGVSLTRSPQSVSLLEIIEACQGKVVGAFCEEAHDLELVCAYHQAMAEFHERAVETLSNWTLADLIERPGPSKGIAKKVDCWMSKILTG